MQFDTLISGGTVHSSTHSARADIAIRGETIAAIGSPGTFTGAQIGRTIDAAGMDVIPGAIDVHVHLELPFCGTVSCDDFDSGSRAAACGGITTVIDFAIPRTGGTLAEAHDTWLAKAQSKSIIDYAWHMAITNRSHIDEIPSMLARGLPTFKEFMIYESEGWNSDDAMMLATLESIARAGDGMLLVHAESPRALDHLIASHHTPALMRLHGARLHAMTRPPVIEMEAVQRCVRWCELTKAPLYIVHMSTGGAADIVRRAAFDGVPILAETCVQYLTLTDDVFSRDDGHLFACCPQVKKLADVERLWAGLSREISVVSTDTCSFTRSQKQMWWDDAGRYGDWTKIPMGLPGLDTLLPLMYTAGVRAQRITINQLVDLCCTTPARLMGLAHRKGSILPGLDADITIIDPSQSRTVTPANLQSRCDWSPFEGRVLHGFARTTISRGETIVEGGRPIGLAGRGRFLERSRVGR